MRARIPDGPALRRTLQRPFVREKAVHPARAATAFASKPANVSAGPTYTSVHQDQ